MRFHVGVSLFLCLAGASGAQEARPAPRTGEFTDEYKDPKTKALVMRYKMRTPAELPAERRLGLIVYFHGMNGNENSLYGFVTGAAGRVGIADEYVITGGKSKGAGWSTSDDKDVLAWIAWIKETYPIDPRRVHLLGASNGGWMVKRFGWEHQDLFATVSPYCGGGVDFSNGPRTGKPGTPLGPAETKTEWYFVHGTDDREVGADSSRRAVRQLRELGYRYVYRELEGHDHGSIFRVPEVADDNLRFIHALRHKEIPLSKEERAKVASLAGKVRTEKAEAMEPILAEAARIGGLPGAKVVANAFDASDPGVRRAAAVTAEGTLYGRETVLELIRLTRDRSEEVRQAAYRALGVAANWRYAEAQEALVRAARSKGTAPPDRVRAIEALGHAVRLMLLGNYEDRLVIWTLVLLLDDEELEVRRAAFAALEKGVKDTFEYRPDLPASERKTAVGKWKSWCEQKAGPLTGGPAGR
jgi:dienelactone hydrolase